MISLKERFENNYLLGAIKFKDDLSFYLMPLAWWFLNYEKYDPQIINDKDFRNGVYNVPNDEVDRFLASIAEDKVVLSEVAEAAKDVSRDFLKFAFFIDFDKNLFVNGYFEHVEPHEYLPDETWTGKEDFAIYYLPTEMQDLLASFRFRKEDFR